MTLMTEAAATFADSRHHPLVTATLVAAFWGGAAIVVAAAQVWVAPRSGLAGAAVAMAAIFGAAWSYTRLCARQAGIAHALGAGIAWLVLSIAIEVVVSMRLGHEWSALLGTTTHPLLRNVVMFVWIFAPACFARREAEEQ